MSTLEHEVIEKFRQLDREAKLRVREVIIREGEQENTPFDAEAWLAEVEAVRFTPRVPAPTASELVNEAREERDADILRGLGFGDTAGDRSD